MLTLQSALHGHYEREMKMFEELVSCLEKYELKYWVAYNFGRTSICVDMEEMFDDTLSISIGLFHSDVEAEDTIFYVLNATAYDWAKEWDDEWPGIELDSIAHKSAEVIVSNIQKIIKKFPETYENALNGANRKELHLPYYDGDGRLQMDETAWENLHELHKTCVEYPQGAPSPIAF
ncbi:hypothetical protein ABIC59_004591 [Priestia aryabhattai]|uniref:hypothetical protein n=1 Tax=Priestia aryabhattai TaxID=412384 RepID=UPI00339AD600